MTQDDKALIRKFWDWHKKRVSRTNSTFDLDYYELVEDLLQIAERHANQNVILRKRYENENAQLIKSNRELIEENTKLHEMHTLLLSKMQEIVQDNIRLTNYANSKTKEGTTTE